MNIFLIIKTLILIGLLSLLVLLGMANQQPVELWAPTLPIVGKLGGARLPAAEMYYCFFGAGLFAGVLIMSGGGKGKK